MAVNVNLNMTIEELGQLFDLDQKKVGFLANTGKAILTPEPDKLHIIAYAPKPSGSGSDSSLSFSEVVPVKLGVLKMVKAGTLGVASKGMIKDALSKAIDNLADHLQYGLTIFDEDDLEEADSAPKPYMKITDPAVLKKVKVAYGPMANKIAAIKELRMLTGLGLTAAKSRIEKWIAEGALASNAHLKKAKKSHPAEPDPVAMAVEAAKAGKGAKVITKEAVMDGPKVALKNAKHLLQPVGGTDSGSRYFAIAIGPLVNVAARIRSTGYTSFRVDGNNIEDAKVVSALSDAGLNSCNGGHWSIHLDVPPEKPMLFKKTVGALLYAMGLPFDQVVSDLTPIIGKGE